MSEIPGLIAAGDLPIDDRAAAPTELQVIGLDLSITSTGVARIDGSTFRIRTRQKDGPRRLTVIRDVLAVEVAEQRPHLAVIEDLPMTTGRMSIANLKTIASLHGVVQAALVDADVPWAYVTPKTLKKYATDNGSASKQDMTAAAFLADGATFDDDEGADQVDAWWLRAAAYDWLGLPLFTMPQAQRDALSKADWPDAYAQRYALGVAA
ncbi:crossover junction endodeoxyribonuclease RuvC [Streptomyces sp. NPDC052043]|uniref:crossover junction endodeoxyribonuclease RuvC n=1 Tax=Streptomyces sp. NPDC052043 TaxID=3365684 RepID=UPI0037D042BE